MRVNEGGPRAEERRAAVVAQRFLEALRSASERDAAGVEEARLEEPAQRGPARRVASDSLDERSAGQGERIREEERGGNVAPPREGPAHAGEPTPAELRAWIRALPVQIDAARVGAGEPLSLSFGRTLEVEIRPGAAGVEILLRPAPRLARVAAAELPAIVAAIRARGIAVARAEVRARGGLPLRRAPAR